MTKKEIVKTISEEMQLTQLKTKEIVQKTFDAIVETLVTERRIELRNFGVFEVKKRAARKARNPRTGERVDVGEKYVVTFKPGKEMEERVRQLEQAEAEGRPLPPRVRPASVEDLFDDEARPAASAAVSPAPRPAQGTTSDVPPGGGRGSMLDGAAPARSSEPNWQPSGFASGRAD